MADDYKEVLVYDSDDRDRDEKSFNDAIESGKIDWSSFSRLMISDICTNTSILETGYIGEWSIKDVEFALKHPRTRWKILLAVSDQLMKTSPHYYRLNTLYSNMAMFNWWIDLYDVKPNANIDTLKKQYGLLASKFENMHLKHEFSKIMRYLPYQDIYCGLVVESPTDFFFQRIDFRICELCQVQDGMYNFRINLSALKASEIDAYPDYVRQSYVDFIEGKKTSKWYTPPADKQICIKMNSQWLYPAPMLIGMIHDILDLDTYKKLKLQSARTDNYKAIMVKVPIDEGAVDKPLLTPETLGVFAEINRESMSDDIGMIHTLGSDGEAISFKDSSNTTNNVSDANDEIYNASGITKELFNGSSSGTAVKFSVENDAGLVYDVYRQFERWMNRFIKLRKYNKPTFKFNFYLLDMTIFNRDDVSKRYKEAVTLGATVIDRWMASLDMTPSRMLGSYVMHNDVFDFQNNFTPLASSYNGAAQESGSEPGRPRAEDVGDTLDVEGEKTRDGEKNDK